MAKKNIDPLRVRQIQEWLLQGQLVTDILRNVISKWSIDESQGIEYISEAFEQFSKKVKNTYGQTKAYHIQMRLNLYKKALEDKQYHVALKILQDLSKIEGVS